MQPRFRDVASCLCLLLALALPASAEDETADEEDIRERLTEREDENQVEDPYTVQVFGHPLALSGTVELSLEATDPILREEGPDGDQRLLTEPELEVEAFYTMGLPFSAFLQARAVMEWDVLAGTDRGVSNFFFERGEMWITSEDIRGTGLTLELGSLDFEDDRLWWWDEDLDAVRLGFEADAFDVELSLASELAPRRSDDDFVEPEQDERVRWIGELSFDLAEDHSLELYFLHDDDQSGHRDPGETLDADREDESDAELWWIGPRAIGGFDLGAVGLLGYWADVAFVFGDETFIEYGEERAGRIEVEEVIDRKVRGFGFDVGLTWFLPGEIEPRMSLGYAWGSGDGSPETGTDRAFRQTGLQANESGFGGVQRFGLYGRLLDPELSNLSVVTVDFGISLLESSSADIAFHFYRLVDRAQSLRDARLETAFDGRNKDVGQAVDLILALEDWEDIEIELSASAFRAGRAWGKEDGEWAFGGFASISYAF